MFKEPKARKIGIWLLRKDFKWKVIENEVEEIGTRSCIIVL